jgi:hypothetical protein
VVSNRLTASNTAPSRGESEDMQFMDMLCSLY